ncbi:ras association domain-containing protein 5 isoform X1 [Tachysurus fulvidraco]|uniref:ras association domain-containing protein 5 isoform X1 n=1 Tax=Tachysurus fulvidraco TaxID=1234273 RepID=UPI001FEE5175|nr:ras association domain-containing protein 5 isoform X1 [Tachysurus fulvidraco]
MASVTLGQHPARHHLDSENLLFRKLANEGKKLMRKPSREKMTRERAGVAATEVVSLNNRLSLDPGSRTALEMCDSIDAEPPRITDRTADTDGDPAARRAPDCACSDAAQAQTRRLADAQNANANNNGISRGYPRRSSAKYINELSHRSGGKRGKFRSLSVDGDTLEGLQLTQGRRGVVKLVRTGQPRRQAWSIFDQDDPEVNEERGEGHRFAPFRVTQDWCDACNRLIKSMAFRCEYCSYTCHLECENHVRLDCNQGNGQKEETCSVSPGRTYSTAPPAKNTTKEVEEEKQQSLTEEEVKAKIEEYNSQVTENGMNLAADGTYNGFIKVHMKLRRPVTVLEKDANSSWNSENSSAEADTSDKRTSFYLPGEALKQLHVSSTTTVREVIEGLLRKYTVQDNPLKFALYKQMHRHGQDLFQKLPDSEYPLLLRLLAGPDLEKLSFVLKENETGEVEWDAFSMPELHNFLAILEKEERERVKQVELRYMTYRKKLINALEEVQNKPG